MPELDEDALIARCRGGDDRAFAELVDQYKDLVFGMVWRLAPDRAHAEDLAQDVFLKVHRGLPYFRGEARLSTWIYRIVANVCAQARSRPRLERSLDTGAGDRPLEPGTRDRAFDDLELRDRLDKAIAQLPEQYRVLVAAHYLQGIQYEALAAALDLPLGTVKTHLYRAKRRLRELLTDDV
ncbi:MAG TPA: sigma-70 family RNA polymerase sigma factor [Vicinamibacterales bacterium]|nr:sigma-70 family RNA polymerase sigma factor [Vicinamibacterales bacterium]